MWYPRWDQRRKMKTEYETLVEQSQAQAKEGLLNPSTFVAPPQVEEPSLTEYSKVMHTARPDTTRPADVFNQIVQDTNNESYTRWYERNGNKHLPGFEIEGAMQLKADRIKRFETCTNEERLGTTRS
jgi:hypothetical protein